jgi:hypothetical protein
MLFLASLIAISNAQFLYQSLESARPRINFIEYTPTERLNVATNLHTLLNTVWINKEEKIRVYGPTKNPLQETTAFIGNATTMTSDSFHSKASEITRRLRDFQYYLHQSNTNYDFPPRHACYNAVQPIQFTFLGIGIENNPAPVIVKSITYYANFRADVAGLTNVAVGDELILIDNQPVADYLNLNHDFSGASNIYFAIFLS